MKLEYIAHIFQKNLNNGFPYFKALSKISCAFFMPKKISEDNIYMFLALKYTIYTIRLI